MSGGAPDALRSAAGHLQTKCVVGAVAGQLACACSVLQGPAVGGAVLLHGGGADIGAADGLVAVVKGIGDGLGGCLKCDTGSGDAEVDVVVPAKAQVQLAQARSGGSWWLANAVCDGTQQGFNGGGGGKLFTDVLSEALGLLGLTSTALGQNEFEQFFGHKDVDFGRALGLCWHGHDDQC